MRRPLAVFAVLSGLLFLSGGEFLQRGNTVHTFDDPIDAVSFGIQGDDDVSVSAQLDDGTWTEWQALQIENEQDPLLRETNLVMFPESVSRIRVRGTADGYDVHPIRISDEPAHYRAAALGSSSARILMRSDWGADDSLLFRSTEPQPTAPATPSQEPSEPAPVSQRIKDCEAAQKNHPQEFRTSNTVSMKDGKRYVWPISYSNNVKLLVVHHTAMEVSDDGRSGVERMRALYEYHAKNRGWGDIGYHYVIDEDGTVYEGKAGGLYAVGGHAYCNNVGTIGISLMGNFDMEVPPQAQMHGLQSLLETLSETYKVDLTKSVTFHGKTFASPVVGHKDLLSTDCPGYYVASTLTQVRSNVIAGNVTQDIRFPVIARRTVTPTRSLGSNIEDRRASRARNVPPERRSRVPRGNVDAASRTWQPTVRRMTLTQTPGQPLARSSTARRTAVPAANSDTATSSRLIRIKLTASQTPVLKFSKGGTAALTANGSMCSAKIGTVTSSNAITRFSEEEFGTATLTENGRSYRGTIECRIVDGSLTLINELPLEEYLLGLAEEPDTEPFEKQRAFAIAARTYALWYIDPANRKFPGKPYDGSDSPAEFQVYAGIGFEQKNPRWLEAVNDTANQVLKKNGSLIKPPYFSASDGRTRSPSEANWKNFPFAEVFASKPDPWCNGLELRGHGVGMSGCGAKAQANEGKTGEEILGYYYPGTEIVVNAR